MVATAKQADEVWYPESDDMGEHEHQTFIREQLRPLLARWFAEKKQVAHAGSDQFFYWVPGDIKKCRSPDVYVVDGVQQEIPAVGTWKVWEGHFPVFAVEVCGNDWEKDYDEAPADYDTMGCQELVVFDPWATTASRRRVRWQVFRRNTAGRLVRVLKSKRDRVRSRWLGCYLREVREGCILRLRLATGELGETIFPTAEEAARAAEETARAAAETATAAAETARAEVAMLKALLAKRSRPRK